MDDNELIQLIITNTKKGAETLGLVNLPVLQAFQPRQQGTNLQTSVYLQKINDKKVGFPREVNLESFGVYYNRQIQRYDSTFQIFAYSIQNPNEVDQYTASDLANLFSQILQDSEIISDFQQNGVGMLRVSAVNNPYFINEQGRFQSAANFDFTLTHERTIVKVDNYITYGEIELIGI